MTRSALSRFFIVGPTASGKSDLAIQIASRCDAEIVGADAFQIYAGLDLLTAKPPKEDLARVPHHLIGEIPLQESCDVALYLKKATQRIAEIQKRGKTALIVGGTGLYVRALTHGLADLPPADNDLRQSLEARPIATLQRELLDLDPLAHSRIDLKNPRRLIRALEVCILTGRPFSSFQTQWDTAPADAAGIFLHPPRETLHARINSRTDKIFAHGIEAEVRAVSSISATARQTLGFSLIQDLIAAKSTRQDCIDSMKNATRQYAKRQLTWFARDPHFERVDIEETAGLEALAQRVAAQITSSN